MYKLSAFLWLFFKQRRWGPVSRGSSTESRGWLSLSLSEPGQSRDAPRGQAQLQTLDMTKSFNLHHSPTRETGGISSPILEMGKLGPD